MAFSLMIKIEHLTPHQVDLLNKMWAIDTEEDLKAWSSTLPIEDQLMVSTLATMVAIACIDEVVEASELEAANDVLSDFRLR